MRDEFYYAEYDENSPETPFSRKPRIDINLPFYECRYDYSFAGSCNGLICIDSWHNDRFGPTYIFNPVTREYITLPKFEGNYWWTGFGYIPSTNEYKVVRVYDTINVRTIHVYTIGSSNGWRNVGTVDRNMPFYRKYAGAFAHGAHHWADDKETILAFDLTDEKGFRRFLSATYYRDALYGEIWLLKRNKDNYDDLSWSKEFSLDICTLRSSPPFGLMKSGRLLCYEDHKIYGYDPEASSAIMDVDFGKSITNAIPHKNTLVSLKILGEKDAKKMESGERASSSEETENSD
ncbi:F-box protein At3g07870-like [Papaver somniferum]|uniref:F-box protein At3g07870-like n=1 Tax=Papaver somniferum TaxID=3469 RepID=UPI000E6FB1CB|nr:F-box protein At3g07870-like [Papaver somniferum]